MPLILNPTGGKIRSDAGGDGHYGAKRSKKEEKNGTWVSIVYSHRGTDFEGCPGQPVYAPISGKIQRKSAPYKNSHYSGVLLVGPTGEIKLWYFQPVDALIGQHVKQGETIGLMQDISQRYANVTPHVHLQIERWNPETLMEGGD